MWDLPRPGLEPVSPALAGGFSTTAPPGKPRVCLFLLLFLFKSFWFLMYHLYCFSHFKFFVFHICSVGMFWVLGAVPVTDSALENGVVEPGGQIGAGRILAKDHGLLEQDREWGLEGFLGHLQSRIRGCGVRKRLQSNLRPWTLIKPTGWIAMQRIWDKGDFRT